MLPGIIGLLVNDVRYHCKTTLCSPTREETFSTF